MSRNDSTEITFSDVESTNQAEYTEFIGKYYPLLKKFARQGDIGNGYTENK